MKVWVIIENSYYPHEFNNDEIHSVVDSEAKAEAFIKNNPPVKTKFSGTVSYTYVAKELE